jgi:RNA polymerase sigma-70 factor (ECF subfamily)
MNDRKSKLRDDLLVLACHEGRADAFGALVDRWQEPLWRYSYRLTGREDVAWDIVQETWIAVAKGLAGLSDPARFRSWVHTIATRRAADRGRREHDDHWEHGAGAGSLDAAVEPAVDEGEPADAVELLRAALKHVSGERRALLSLFYVDDFDLREIADVLGVPEGTVKSRLHHAREELRAIIENLERTQR